MTEPRPSFELCAVVHLLRPTGERAHDLEQLRALVQTTEPRALFQHAVQYQLRNPGADELPPDDFSAWVGGVVQDRETAERLSYVIQTRSRSADELRAGILGVLDSIPAATRVARDVPSEGDFIVLTADSVVFPTERVAAHEGELMEALAEEDSSVWFYHLIEQPWFHDGHVPLVEWLQAIGQPRLGARLLELSTAGLPIETARRRLLQGWNRVLLAHRVAAAAAAPEDERREAGREAVARLARRLHPPPEPQP